MKHLGRSPDCVQSGRQGSRAAAALSESTCRLAGLLCLDALYGTPSVPRTREQAPPLSHALMLPPLWCRGARARVAGSLDGAALLVNQPELY